MNSDAHTVENFDHARNGLFIARRAGLKASQIINTWSSSHLKQWLKKKRKPNAELQ
jgi:histidinol phosphatase-like PHP family hydrolase